MKRRGHQYVALCPFHDERTPSFYINDNKNVYKCWGCGAGGGIFRFIMDMERISFPEAVELLAARAGITIERDKSGGTDLRKKIDDALESFNSFFFQKLLGREGGQARIQLKSRGFTKEICQTWDIGFAPDNYALSQSEDMRSKTGMSYDNGTNRFRNRIMFGIRNESGKLVGFSGRTIINHPAKYLNSPETMVFQKGKLLYGLDKAKRSIIDKGQIVIVEGQIDCIRCHLHGITNAVAPLGTGFTSHHASLVRRISEEAVLVFDSDKAGQEAARKAHAGLSSLGIRVRAFMLPAKTDPDEFILGGGNLADAISNSKLYPEALAHSLDCSTLEAKQNAMKSVGFALSVMDDGIERDEITARCAKVLGIKPNQLRKQAIFHGGHEAIPTSKLGKQTSETMRQLLAHLLYCGKEKALAYDWRLISDPDIQIIMASEYEPSNPSSLMPLFAKLDSSVEAVVSGMGCDEVINIDIKAIYRSMIEAEIRNRAESVASGGKAVDLMPLLDKLKTLN